MHNVVDMKKLLLFAFRVSTNGEAVDITKNIVEQHVGEFIQLDSIDEEWKHPMVSAVKKK